MDKRTENNVTIWTQKESFPVLVLLLLTALSACRGSQEASSVSIAPPPLVPTVTTPPAPPVQTVGDIQFTVDNSIAESQNIAFEGGELVLDVPGGARFTVSVPNGAFFAVTSTVTMQSIVDTQGLAPGLIPVAAVNLGPSGENFAVQPILEIDLRSLSRPTGNIVIFLANDDGTGLTYLLPEADDMVEAVLSDGPYRARIPHFSGVGVAVSDPNGPGIPDAGLADTAEIKARQALNQIIEDQAREVIMGQRMPGEVTTGLEPIIAEWHNDLGQRVNEFTDDTILEEFESITNELFRFLETSRTLNISGGMPMLEETEVGAEVVRKLAIQIHMWNERCKAGNGIAIERIKDRIAFLRSLLSADLLGESTFRSIDQPGFCLSN